MALATIPAATSDSSSSRQTNLAYTAVASRSSGGSGSYGPQKMNDGVYFSSTFAWISTPGYAFPCYPNSAWMKYTWSSPVSVSSFRIWQGYGYTPRRYLYGADVQFWDGSTFQTVMTYAGQTNVWYEIQLPYPVTTTEFRLYDLRGWTNPTYPNQQASNPAIAEWEVFGPSGITADVRVEPQSLNLDSNGNYVSFKVFGFPDNPEYTPYDVDPNQCTVGGVNADLKYGTVNDNKYIGKADRLLVEDAIGAPGDEVEVNVNGMTYDGIAFFGKAVIKAV
jgi:hypothetical protein